LGVNCIFEYKSWQNPHLREEFEKAGLFPVCYKVLGRLGVPRIPAEIVRGDSVTPYLLQRNAVKVTCVKTTG
jgi:uncharacterized protein YbbK (DUF523 family)